MKHPDLALGPEWALLELLCQPANADRDQHLHDLLHHPGLHWGELLEQALRHKLLPLLAAHLDTLPADPVAPKPVAAHLHQVWRAHQHRSSLYRTEAHRITRRLTRAGIPVVAIRGLALESSLYAGARSFTDLDLLIPPTEYQHASALLHGLGYTPGPPGSHHRRIVDPTTSTLVLDVATIPEATQLDQATCQNADRLHQRLFATQPQIPEELPTPTSADHALLLAWALGDKGERGASGVTLLAFADLLRLITATPPTQTGDLAALAQGWPAAHRRLQWTLAGVDHLFGTDHLVCAGLAHGANSQREAARKLRARLHAKRLPTPALPTPVAASPGPPPRTIRYRQEVS